MIVLFSYTDVLIRKTHSGFQIRIFNKTTNSDGYVDIDCNHVSNRSVVKLLMHRVESIPSTKKAINSKQE